MSARTGAAIWIIGAVVLACSGATAGSTTPATSQDAGPSVFHDEPTSEAAPPTPFGSPFVLGGSCGEAASDDRCQALAFAASIQLGVAFDAVRTVDIVPNPSPEAIDFAHRTFLEVSLADGSTHNVVISCPGVSGASNPPCMSMPTVPLGFPRGPEGGGGYTDLPGEPTPFPSLQAAAIEGARPLRIEELSVPIAHAGSTSVVVGNAVLPNGYLSAAHFGLADAWPSDVLFNGGIVMDVRSLASGEPLRNLYEHGWVPGVEAVQVTITFDVAWFTPGAAVHLTDIVVR